MRAILIGANRAEIGIFATKDLDKRFYESRGQAYRFYPQELRQIQIYDGGTLTECDECLVYPECGRVPYHVRDMDGYRLDWILGEVDVQKAMTPKGVFGPPSIFARMGGGLSKLVPYFGLIVAAVVIVWAVLAG